MVILCKATDQNKNVLAAKPHAHIPEAEGAGSEGMKRPYSTSCACLLYLLYPCLGGMWLRRLPRTQPLCLRTDGSLSPARLCSILTSDISQLVSIPLGPSRGAFCVYLTKLAAPSKLSRRARVRPPRHCRFFPTVTSRRHSLRPPRPNSTLTAMAHGALRRNDRLPRPRGRVLVPRARGQ